MGIIMAATLVSRLLGWVKMTALSSLYGRTIETDAFIGAFTIPDLVYLLVSGGAMTAAFIPIFTEFITAGKEEEGWRVASTIWNMLAAVLIAFIILGEIFADKVVLLLPGFRHNPEALVYATSFVRILFPMLLFTALAALCNGILHSYNHFVAPSISWTIYNIVFIAAAVISYKNIGLKGICYGVIIGAAMMVAVQLPVMFNKGMKYSLSFDYKHPAVVRYWKLFLPVMLGMSLTQINLMIMPTVFGSLVGKGAITALNFANRLMFIPLGMFGSAVSMAIFPAMSRQAAAGDFDQVGKSLARGIRATLIFSLPSTAVMLTAGLAGIKIVFGHGKFGYIDCLATAQALSFFAVGLMGHSANQVINRGFYAHKDSRTPVVAGLIGLLITIPLSLILIKTPLKHSGIALAVSAATLLNMAILMALAAKKLRLDISAVLTMFAKTLTAAAVATAAGWAVGKISPFHLSQNNFSLSAALISFIAVGSATGLAFAAASKLLKIEEFDELLAQVAGRLRLKKA